MFETPRNHIALAATPSAARDAREFVALVLRHRGLDALHDAAALVVSELVTNALRATTDADLAAIRATPFGRTSLSVQLTVRPDGLRLAVHDSSTRLPHPEAPADDAEQGRGLLLVQAVSTQWGAYRLPNGSKAVWAELTTTTHPGAHATRDASLTG